MLICLEGDIGSGKGEVGKILERHGFAAVAFADPMKRVLVDVYGFTPDDLWGPSARRGVKYKRYPRDVDMTAANPGEEFLTPRFALQALGDWASICYRYIWVERALEIAEALMANPLLQYDERRGAVQPTVWKRLAAAVLPPLPRRGVVFTDGRQHREFEGMKKAGAKLVRVKSPWNKPPQFNHNTELEHASLPDEYFDYVLWNDGSLAALGEKVAGMLSELGA